MNEAAKATLSKVPEVTLGFWVIKIIATTIGETGGDAVTMSMLHADKNAHNGGYLIGTGIFMVMFIAAVIAQIVMKRFHPVIYWVTIVATTTVGTTMADFADRSLGIGYRAGHRSACSAPDSLLVWRWREGTVSVNTVATRRVEAFYWTTILFSQTLGTALGDWMADTNGLGFENAALVFGAALLVLAAAYYFSRRVAGVAVLGGLHPDAPARRDARRLARQTHRLWRIRLQPNDRDCNSRRAIVALILLIPQRPGRPPGRAGRGAGGMIRAASHGAKGRFRVAEDRLPRLPAAVLDGRR